jgi:hypothetical protein
VPLSEHEQRLLEQMERALYAEDPKFASTLRGSDLRVRYRRRIILAALAFLVGIAMLFAGVAGKLIPISVLGFVVMLASAWWAVSAYRRSTTATAATGDGPAAVSTPRLGGRSGGRSGRARSKSSMMDRLEERWRRRRDSDGR